MGFRLGIRRTISKQYTQWIWKEYGPAWILLHNWLPQKWLETWFCEVLSQEPFLTEKTWKPIIHNLPFIHVGQPGSFDKLKKLGFKTFEEYLLVPYDHITDQEERMSAVIENIAYWFDHIHDHKDNIIKDIQHNYQHFLKTIHDLESDLDSKGIKELLPTSLEYIISRYSQFRLTSS